MAMRRDPATQSPTEYFKNSLGDNLKVALHKCLSEHPGDPIEFLSTYLEDRITEENRIRKIPTSLYFRKIFGSNLHDVLFETVALRPENPLNFVANFVSDKWISTRRTRHMKRDYPKVMDVNVQTSKAILHRRNPSSPERFDGKENITALMKISKTMNSFVVVTDII